MATKMKAVSFHEDKEVDDKIYELRKQDRFMRCSKSDIIRHLIEEGLKAAEEEKRNVGA